MLTIYHNPRCSKSRETLDLLEENKQNVTIVEYLKEPPSAEELREILRKLDMHPQEILRKGEAIYKEKFSGKDFTDEEWIQILSENPVLLERPIVVSGDKAVIGRPPANVMDLLEKR